MLTVALVLGAVGACVLLVLVFVGDKGVEIQLSAGVVEHRCILDAVRRWAQREGAECQVVVGPTGHPEVRLREPHLSSRPEVVVSLGQGRLWIDAGAALGMEGDELETFDRFLSGLMEALAEAGCFEPPDSVRTSCVGGWTPSACGAE